MSAVTWPWALAHIRVFFHLWEVGILAGGVQCVILTLCAHQAPDWVDAEECHRCRVQFGVVTRKVSVPAPGGVCRLSSHVGGPGSLHGRGRPQATHRHHEATAHA